MREYLCTTLSALLMLTLFSAHAQDADSESYTAKGRILLGTSIGVSYTGLSSDLLDDNLTVIDIEVDGGYFFANNLVAGIISGYSHTKFGDISNWSAQFGVFARYYTKPRIFIGAGYLYSDTKDSDNYGTIPAEVGYAWFLNRNVALEPAITFAIPGHNNEGFIYSIGIGLGIYLN